MSEQTDDFLLKLAKDGGMIVSSNDCSEHEIAFARACGRFVIVDKVFGFVRKIPLSHDDKTNKKR